MEISAQEKIKFYTLLTEFEDSLSQGVNYDSSLEVFLKNPFCQIDSEQRILVIIESEEFDQLVIDSIIKFGGKIEKVNRHKAEPIQIFCYLHPESVRNFVPRFTITKIRFFEPSPIRQGPPIIFY